MHSGNRDAIDVRYEIVIEQDPEDILPFWEYFFRYYHRILFHPFDHSWKHRWLMWLSLILGMMIYDWLGGGI